MYVHAFRTNNVRFPLYLVMVQDGHGHGQVVAFAFVKNKTEVYIRRLFEAFQQAKVEACSKVQVVLTDKDFVERQTVSRLLPQASLHLCIFHVLRAFSCGIAECNLNQSQRERVSEIFEQLVYAHDENEFNEARSELQSFPSEANYYNRCLEICKHQWAFCYTKSNLSFGNRTNNIVESQNHKIKMALNGKVTFIESIRKLMKLFNIQHDEHMQQNALADARPHTCTILGCHDSSVQN